MQPYRDAPVVVEDSEVLRIRAILEPELDDGEPLSWVGSPKPGIYLQARDLFQIPFSLMWGGFAIFWEASAIRMHAPIFMVLWGLPFVAIGLYMIFGRFFVEARRRARTFYGLTDKRVLLVVVDGTRKTFSVDLRMLAIGTEERPDGSGTIWLGGSSLYGTADAKAFADTAWPMQPRNGVPQPALVRIRDVRAVAAKIRAAVEAVRPPDRSSNGDA